MFIRPNQFRNSKADVQIFYQNSNWTKPPGVSQIYMMLIGGGGNAIVNGGGSGSVTVWYGAAQNVPNNLQLSISTGNAVNTTISYIGTTTTVLLTANGANGSTGATATGAGVFANTGFYQSVAGQNGTAATHSASPTTFLSGGCIGGGINAANYGYSATNNPGFFQLQPIIVGCGSADDGVNTNVGGIGCGSGLFGSPVGGNGLILIASW